MGNPSRDAGNNELGTLGSTPLPPVWENGSSWKFLWMEKTLENELLTCSLHSQLPAQTYQNEFPGSLAREDLGEVKKASALHLRCQHSLVVWERKRQE